MVSKGQREDIAKRTVTGADELEGLLQKEIERRNYVLAVALAQKIGGSESRIRYLQELALVQMACEYRNESAVLNLTKKWGFSKTEIESLLRTALEEYERTSDKKRLGQCYDVRTGKYLTLRQWVERFLELKDI